eukprot:5849254-Alexandrium_andersonii.AAC.1
MLAVEPDEPLREVGPAPAGTRPRDPPRLSEREVHGVELIADVRGDVVPVRPGHSGLEAADLAAR